MEEKNFVKAKALSTVKEFAEFINKQNVVGLAVGVTLGGATTSLVKSLVDNIINPIIGLFTKGGQPFSSFVIGPVKVGAFINSLIDFLIIVTIVYLVINKAMKFFTTMGIEKVKETVNKKKQEKST
ncbi:MAG: MscL family protein [Patescibacteria group bacterium]